MLNDKGNTSNFIELEERESAAGDGHEENTHVEYVEISLGEKSKEIPQAIQRVFDLKQRVENKISNIYNKLNDKITFLILDIDDWVAQKNPNTGNIKMIFLFEAIVLEFSRFIASALVRLAKPPKRNLNSSSVGSDREIRLRTLAQKEQSNKFVVYFSTIFSLILMVTLGVIILFGLYTVVKGIDVPSIDVGSSISRIFENSIYFIVEFMFDIFISMIFGFLLGEF